MKGLLSLFALRYPATLVYMIQSTEYEVTPYIRWYWRTTDFTSVEKRRSLDKTRRAKLMLAVIAGGMAVQYVLGLGLAAFSLAQQNYAAVVVGVALALITPVLWAHLFVVPLLIAGHFIVKPKDKKLIDASARQFASLSATKIAVAGSYGKTTMKEFLRTILGEGKKVAATPGNKNVALSHAKFVHSLDGDEEVVIIEYGEGQPGDVARFCKVTQPQIGIITGLAPAHLDHYKTVAAAGKDIFSLAEYLSNKGVYVNNESADLKDFLEPTHVTYSAEGVDGWKVHDITVDLQGTSFRMKKGKRELQLHSKVLGRHLVGPLAACVAIADTLGLTNEQILAGVAKTAPYEHRMQPYSLAGGWVIDDTYNGNLEGIRVGLDLLKTLPATRKTYVTPGLVDQGDENERVHKQIGKLIAGAKPDRVVLMNNSVTDWIVEGLKAEGYEGVIDIENDPLNFYTSLDHIIVGGEVILMQNDWTDNYN